MHYRLAEVEALGLVRPKLLPQTTISDAMRTPFQAGCRMEHVERHRSDGGRIPESRKVRLPCRAKLKAALGILLPLLPRLDKV